MYVTYTRIYGWSDYGGESSYQPGYRLENMMWMTLLVYDYIIPGEKESLIVLCNFTDETVEYEVDESVKAERSELVISNYKDAPEKFASKITMKPYGAYVYYTK